MFTVKFYGGHRTRILAAESFTILRSEDGAEITLHQKNQADDTRVDVGHEPPESERPAAWPPIYQRAIIENAMGRTTEIIDAHEFPRPSSLSPKASRPKGPPPPVTNV